MIKHKIKVRGFHCDIYGHVNNARYLEFLEEVRWEWLNSMASMEFLMKRRISFVIVSITIHYRSAAFLNDELEVTAELKHITNRSGIVSQKITRVSDSKLISDAEVTFVLLDTQSGKSIIIDEELKNMMVK